MLTEKRHYQFLKAMQKFILVPFFYVVRRYNLLLTSLGFFLFLYFTYFCGVNCKCSCTYISGKVQVTTNQIDIKAIFVYKVHFGYYCSQISYLRIPSIIKKSKVLPITEVIWFSTVRRSLKSDCFHTNS